ncbi:hypothetical protein L5515_002405 [Caenorhabditis briggsae]|uniref:Uncharacterized protein n=1 Tax=Caenorhabditis briggsae TaxID=6238 RepID=A0AAE9J5M4_CAEBR|nr:hypothetical protein L5515_002405 [Caenorhabditis briggsae]
MEMTVTWLLAELYIERSALCGRLFAQIRAGIAVLIKILEENGNENVEAIKDLVNLLENLLGALSAIRISSMHRRDPQHVDNVQASIVLKSLSSR